MRRILLIGKTGQVGWELERTLGPLGDLCAPGRDQLDLTSADSIRNAIRTAKPDIIVNAAGFTRVDDAESQADLAMQVNSVAPGIMAEGAKEVGALLIHFSTTFVFDGAKSAPYVEDDVTGPVNAYGKSKLAGERAVAACEGQFLILRANWTYSARRINFVLTLLKLAKQEATLRVVDDQIGSPTWARAYANATAALIGQEQCARSNGGIYHLSASGHTTRYEFARKIIEIARRIDTRRGRWPEVLPISSAEYPTPARRPFNTATDNTKINQVFGIEMSPWQEQLETFMSQSPEIY